MDKAWVSPSRVMQSFLISAKRFPDFLTSGLPANSIPRLLLTACARPAYG